MHKIFWQEYIVPLLEEKELPSLFSKIESCWNIVLFFVFG